MRAETHTTHSRATGSGSAITGAQHACIPSGGGTCQYFPCEDESKISLWEDAEQVLDSRAVTTLDLRLPSGQR